LRGQAFERESRNSFNSLSLFNFFSSPLVGEGRVRGKEMVGVIRKFNPRIHGIREYKRLTKKPEKVIREIITREWGM